MPGIKRKLRNESIKTYKDFTRVSKKHGDIEVLSCPKEFYIATGSNYFTDDLNIDCNDNTLDWQGNRAIKIYGYV